MSNVISLGKARKAKASAEAYMVAEANRAKFGRTKAEKARDAMDEERRERLLDDSKRAPE